MDVGVKSQECVHQKPTPSVMTAPMNWPETHILRIVIHYHYQKIKSQVLISWGFLHLVWTTETKFGGLSHALAITQEINKIRIIFFFHMRHRKKSTATLSSK